MAELTREAVGEAMTPFACPVDDMCDCGIACMRAPKPTVCHSEAIAEFYEGEHRYEETLDADERQGH